MQDGFGERIRRARLRKNGMKQEDLARILGVTQNAVSGWECGEHKPRFEMLERIAEALGVTRAELLGVSPSTPALRIDNLTVRLVPVVKNLCPDGVGLLDPGNVVTHAPFPSTSDQGGAELVAFRLPCAAGEYLPNDILFIATGMEYQPSDKVLIAEANRVIVLPYSDVPQKLYPDIVGAVVGFYREA